MLNSEYIKQFGEFKERIDKSKAEIATTVIEVEAGGNLVQIAMTGDRKLQSLKINTDLKLMETDDLEDLLTVALQRALDETELLQKRLLGESTTGLFPNF
jgi:DNA-binding protein YbaB